MSDLSLVSIADILTELRGRYDHMVFAGTKITGLAADEHEEAWSGNVTFCTGMAANLIRTMQDWALNGEYEEN